MACRRVLCKDKNGETHGAIACGPKPRARACAFCANPDARALCDWPIGGGKTCDKPCCFRCRRRVGQDLDYCRDHWDADAVPAAAGQGELFT